MGLTNNQLKIIAVIAMLSDHIGRELLPKYEFLTIAGRIAFPIFAYMIGEGCFYTKNRSRYFITMLCMALGCQIIYFIVTGSMYQNILVTFSLSILTIFTIDALMSLKSVIAEIGVVFLLCFLMFICVFVPNMVKGDFQFDYGFFGVMLPVAVYYAPRKREKLICMTLILTALSYVSGGSQWYCLFAVGLLMLYNSERGKYNLKYLFYIFYPAHLALIYLIKMIIEK